MAAALRHRGWDVVEIDADRDLAAKLTETRATAAWIALHGRFGEDGCVQGMLEVMGIPYTGSGVQASAVAMDKIATKRAVQALADVRLAADCTLRSVDEWNHQLPMPVVVKPSVGGSTIGIQLVTDASDMPAALQAAFELCSDVLVESVIVGDEITVAVLHGEALPVVRIVPDSGFFDFEAKYEKGKTVYEVPAPIDAAHAAVAQRAAVAVYQQLGCCGLARVDFMVSNEGPVFLEINTIPGMTATSLSPMAAGAAGIDFETLVERLLLDARCVPSENELCDFAP